MNSLFPLRCRPLVLLGCLAGFLFSPRLAAQITLADWHTPGDQLLIVDQTAGLQFLNLQVTVGLSVNDVTAQLEIGGNYAGFRYATLTELNATLTRISVPTVDPTGLTTFITTGELATFYSYFGKLKDDEYGTRSYGFVDGPDPTYPPAHAAVIFDHNTLYGHAPRNTVGGAMEDFGASHLGHFLVAPAASAVPEPSTYALLAGLAALGGAFIRRIKRARAPQT